MQTTIVQRRCKILTKKQRNKSQNKGKNAENRAAPTARKTRAQHTVQKAGRGPGRMKNLPGEKNKRKMAKKRAERKRHGQREGKGRRIGRACTAARRDAGWLLSAAFFISDLTGMASLAKSGTGESSAEHSIKKGCGKAQREMDGLPGWGIMGAKVRLRCFGGKGTGQTADRYRLEQKIYKGACFKMRCAYGAESRNEREKEKTPNRAFPFLILGFWGEFILQTHSCCLSRFSALRRSGYNR